MISPYLTRQITSLLPSRLNILHQKIFLFPFEINTSLIQLCFTPLISYNIQNQPV